MSSPNKHKAKIYSLLEKLRREMCLLYEHKHVKYPAKRLPDVELDIHELTQEVERMQLVNRSKKKWKN